jgi:hypothetical protein
MRNIRARKTVFNLAAPVALAAALALIVASCAQQSESPVAPSGVRGGTLNEDTGGTPSPTPEPTVEPTPTPSPTPPAGVPCSPGFWKNHEDDFNHFCGAAAALTTNPRLDSCPDLLTALTCRGSDADCLRSAAAELLNTVSRCVE